MSAEPRRLVPVPALTVGVLGAIAVMVGSLTPWPAHVEISGATAAVLGYAATAAGLLHNWDDSDRWPRR